MAKKGAEAHIVEELLRSGFPLEIDISAQLERNWLIFNNEPYFDADENKTREIDISAVHLKEINQFARKNEPNPLLGIRLIVECKKSETHAWIFFTRPFQYSDMHPSMGEFQIFDFLQVLSHGKVSLLGQPTSEPVLPNLHHLHFDRQAYTYSEVKLQGQSSSKSEIFEAQNQLLKYLAFSNEQTSKMISRDVTRRDVDFTFLTIVFDGILYEATVANGKPSLRKKNHILLASRARKGEDYETCIIDVVRASWFPKYLDLIEDDVKEIFRFFKTNRRELLQKIENLTEAFLP